MGKRAHQKGFQTFERRASDFYATPSAAVDALIPFLPARELWWCEPCVGDGALVRHLAADPNIRFCIYSCDIDPTGDALEYSYVRDCLKITEKDCVNFDIQMFITNPPWPRPHLRGEPTIGIIRHLSALRPSWFLMPADMGHNDYMTDLLDHCSHIVSVGRVKWMPGTRSQGVDNSAWYRFDMSAPRNVPRFYSRKDWSQIVGSHLYADVPGPLSIRI